MVMEIARKNSVSRIKRCGQIMGRHNSKDGNDRRFRDILSQIHRNRHADKSLSAEQFAAKYPAPETADESPVAQLLYPLMQCADVFFLNAHICQLGVDQQKVNVLAREFCAGRGSKERRLRKPVIIAHPMLMGLKEGQEKMSKSDPDSAVFMEDSAEDVRRKLKKAFCRPGDVEKNPVLEYLRLIVFPWHEARGGLGGGEFEFEVRRSEENGGDVAFGRFSELKEAFAAGKLHPSDLKPAVARELNALLEPVREHFSSGEPRQLLVDIKKYQKR